jgi:hypothetical protein
MNNLPDYKNIGRQTDFFDKSKGKINLLEKPTIVLSSSL